MDWNNTGASRLSRKRGNERAADRLAWRATAAARRRCSVERETDRAGRPPAGRQSVRDRETQTDRDVVYQRARDRRITAHASSCSPAQARPGTRYTLHQYHRSTSTPLILKLATNARACAAKRADSSCKCKLPLNANDNRLYSRGFSINVSSNTDYIYQ